MSVDLYGFFFFLLAFVTLFAFCTYMQSANCITFIVADVRPNESTIALCVVIIYNHLLQVSVDLYVVVVFVVVVVVLVFFLSFFFFLFIFSPLSFLLCCCCCCFCLVFLF